MDSWWFLKPLLVFHKVLDLDGALRFDQSTDRAHRRDTSINFLGFDFILVT